MKKTMIAFFALFIATASFAQTKPAIGIRAGANFTKVKSSEGITKQTNGVGPNAGIFLNLPVAGGFSFQPELAYTSMGFNHEVAGVTHKYNYNYLQIPILAKYTFGTSGFSALAGPQLGILLNAKHKAGDVKTDFKDRVNNTDFSMGFGAEFEIPATKLNVGARYQLGLSNFNKNGFGNSDVKHTGFTVLLGYKF